MNLNPSDWLTIAGLVINFAGLYMAINAASNKSESRFSRLETEMRIVLDALHLTPESDRRKAR